MRVFAVSDLHVDYSSNARWVDELSNSDFKDDVLILPGDVSDSLSLLDWCLTALVARFFRVLFVPGNHELWVVRDPTGLNSLQKFQQVRKVAEQCGAMLEPFYRANLAIVPLLGWYDWSFGAPCEKLRTIWMDFQACRWPEYWQPRDITEYFTRLNPDTPLPSGTTTISFSHFLPRIDLMPSYIPLESRIIYPALGSTLLEQQLRGLGSTIHVYGHSHVNCEVTLGGTTYINNAFAYPYETRIAAKALRCIYDAG